MNTYSSSSGLYKQSQKCRLACHKLQKQMASFLIYIPQRTMSPLAMQRRLRQRCSRAKQFHCSLDSSAALTPAFPSIYTYIYTHKKKKRRVWKGRIKSVRYKLLTLWVMFSGLAFFQRCEMSSMAAVTGTLAICRPKF